MATTLIVGALTFAPQGFDAERFAAVQAEVKLYSAMGLDYGNEYESQDIVKLRARDKAIKNAVEQAGVYLKSYSRSVNGKLTDDEITAITSNAYEVVGEVKYNCVIKQVTDQITLIIWEATVEVNVDDAEVTKWVRRENDEQVRLVSQTREANEAAVANERKIEDLRKRAQTVTNDTERTQLKAEFEQVDNEFLSNQKVEEANKLVYRDKHEEAIKLYDEAIELKPDNAVAYNRRGITYNAVATIKSLVNKADVNSRERRQAISDLDKAIELKHDYSEAYGNRGFVYYMAKDYPKAIKDFERAIALKPDNAQNYIYRSLYYRQVAKDNRRGLADLNKAIELEPNNAWFYHIRAAFYEYDAKNDEAALADYTRAIELEGDSIKQGFNYNARAKLYKKLKFFEKAVEDYTRAIELGQENMLALNYLGRGQTYQEIRFFGKAIEDYTRAIDLAAQDESSKSFLPWIYYCRSECYKALGDTAKAQADMKKYDELKK